MQKNGWLNNLKRNNIMWVKTISGWRFLEVEQNSQGFYIFKKL